MYVIYLLQLSQDFSVTTLIHAQSLVLKLIGLFGHFFRAASQNRRRALTSFHVVEETFLCNIPPFLEKMLSLQSAFQGKFC